MDTLETYQLTYASYKKSLKNGKASATVDIEEEHGDKDTLPRRPRGHKATSSDIKREATALALSETFKGWMFDKDEAIAKREEKMRREKEATCNQLFNLTKKAIEVEESMTKTKTLEAEAKLMVKEREIIFIDTTNMMEEQKAWVEKLHAIASSNNGMRDHT
jgi:FtsZ-binding cell division protein ZapB